MDQLGRYKLPSSFHRCRVFNANMPIHGAAAVHSAPDEGDIERAATHEPEFLQLNRLRAEKPVQSWINVKEVQPELKFLFMVTVTIPVALS